MKLCPRCSVEDSDSSRTRCLVCGGELVEREDPRIGETLAGRYRIEAVIGQGGMSTVYRARHTMMDRPYAVKVMRRELAADELLVERMRREARSTAALSHPNIIEVYDFGFTEDGAPYLVMELLSGEPLRGLLRGKPLPRPLLYELATQAARGLARAHDFGIVHRDVKPENIFVSEDADGSPHVRLVDFGIARSPQDAHLTHRGELIGTPHYMAPERATSRDVTPASDLYSFGVVLYEMATGALPFQSNNPTSYVLKHMHEAPPPPRRRVPDMPAGLEALILELLEKVPERRPVDAHQVVERLRALAPGGPIATPRPSQVPSEIDRPNRVTLDGWSFRIGLIEQLVNDAHPGAAPPAAVSEVLASLRAQVKSMRALQEEGVRLQAELDHLEREGREGSERLGHAVHVLAKDLSRARDEARSAASESDSRASVIRGARDEVVALLAQLDAMAESHPEHPDPALVEVSRALADAALAWSHADQALERSRTRAGQRAREVADLEFQLDALRTRLERLDEGLAGRGDTARARLNELGDHLRATQEDVAALAERCVAPYRERPELSSVVRMLDGHDVPTPRAAARH